VRKQLPLPAQLALIVGGALLVLALGYFIAVGPLSHKAAGLRNQTAAVQQQIADDLAQVAAARGVGAAAAAQTIKVADVYKLAKAMPAVTDMPDVLIELDQTARAAGVDLQTLTPGGASTAGTNGYSMLPLTMTVAGNFYTVTDLLYRLRNLVYVRGGALQANGRLFSVNSVSLSPSNGKSISAQIAVDTYVYGGAIAAVPSSTTPSTTTTTTTTTPPSGPSAAGATP
jgi:Tfp pilus assembly protein PilO